MTAPTLTHALAEVAPRIPCSERWLAEQIRAGRITARKVGRHWRMTDDDIAAPLESLRIAPSGRKTVTEPRPLGLTATSLRRRRSAA